jgi:dihydroorotase
MQSHSALTLEIDLLQAQKHTALIIQNGRVIDPFTGRDEVADLFITDGRIANTPAPNARKLDADGCIVAPGLMDIHVHLREPGQSHKETIETGTASAAAGGFTYVTCMPNTSPPIDSPDTVRWIRERAESVGHCEVAPIAAMTQGRGGRELTNFAALLEAGAIAFSDDGAGVEDDAVMHAAFEQAARLDALLIQHCEYAAISAGGVMHLGEVSRRLGLPGLDPRSEEAMIERDIDLCRQTGSRYHVAHISTARAIEMVRRAKREGLPVTSEVCTHHLLLTDEACESADPNTKMHPPLRPRSDVDACRAGLLDGTIDCIVTDHAPHTASEKAVGFLKAPAGIVGLETALGVAAEAIIAPGLADWPQLISWLTAKPAGVVRVHRHGIQPNATADFSIVNPNLEWVARPHQFLSKGRNTPFASRGFIGRAVATIRGDTVRDQDLPLE